ncbi:MAG: DUF4290 domain-containing protein [Bacteroidales bacterium]|nr:DUF4290 domain-containing protein [Bacteroidales bacterium]
MEYNTQQKKLSLPEYGRSIQHMVDHAVSIADKTERQLCAETIIKVMKGMSPQLREVPDGDRKLWDHLIIMSDFKLDVDCPFEVIKKEALETTPKRIPYPTEDIKYRHYGKLLQQLIEKAQTYSEGPEKDELLLEIANQMKRDFVEWNKEGVEDAKILGDLANFTKGEVKLNSNEVKLCQHKPSSQESGRKNTVQKKKNKKRN